MSISPVLFQKPIVWGKEKSKYIIIENNEITIYSQKTSIPQFIQSLGELLVTSEQELKENLNSRTIRELKILYINLENLLNKTISYYNYPIRKIYHEFWLLNKNPNKSLKELSDIVFEAINFKEKWNRPCLDCSIPPKIKEAITADSGVNSKSIFNIYQQYIYKRKYYEEDYCITIHAQSTYFNQFCDLVKEIQKAKSTETDYHQFKFLRDPTSLTPYTDLQDFFEKAYKLGFNDHDYTADLIAADLFDENLEEAESAYDFLKRNANATNPTSVIDEALGKIFGSSLSASQIKRIEEKKEKFQEIIKKNTSTGNLVMICIPKSLAYSDKNPMWLSKPHGFRYRFTSSGSFKEAAECLMNRQLDEAKSHIEWHLGVPQVRILANQLKPGEVKIFRINDLKNPVKKECKELARSIFDIMQEP